MLIAPPITTNVTWLPKSEPVSVRLAKHDAFEQGRATLESKGTLEVSSPEISQEEYASDRPLDELVLTRNSSPIENLSLLPAPISQEESAFGGKLHPEASEPEEMVLELSLLDPLALEALDLDESFQGATPLEPLRERDIKALAGFFERSDAEEIEADVSQVLSRLFPEPCWDDRVFDFLGEYV